MWCGVKTGTDETSSLILLKDKSSGGSAHQQKHEAACCPGPRLCQRGTNMWDERGGCSLASYLHSSLVWAQREISRLRRINRRKVGRWVSHRQVMISFLFHPQSFRVTGEWVPQVTVLQIFLQLWKQRFLQEEVDIRAQTETGAKSAHKNAKTERAADGRKGEKYGWQRCCLTERFAAHPRSFRCMEE